jgi:hypothetical protein
MKTIIGSLLTKVHKNPCEGNISASGEECLVLHMSLAPTSYSAKICYKFISCHAYLARLIK